VDRASDEFLAGPRLAFDQYGSIDTSEIVDQSEQTPHRVALADKVFELALIIQEPPQTVHLGDVVQKHDFPAGVPWVVA
jgi:hypothetical protein